MTLQCQVVFPWPYPNHLKKLSAFLSSWFSFRFGVGGKSWSNYPTPCLQCRRAPWSRGTREIERGDGKYNCIPVGLRDDRFVFSHPDMTTFKHGSINYWLDAKKQVGGISTGWVIAETADERSAVFAQKNKKRILFLFQWAQEPYLTIWSLSYYKRDYLRLSWRFRNWPNAPVDKQKLIVSNWHEGRAGKWEISHFLQIQAIFFLTIKLYSVNNYSCKSISFSIILAHKNISIILLFWLPTDKSLAFAKIKRYTWGRTKQTNRSCH